MKTDPRNSAVGGAATLGAALEGARVAAPRAAATDAMRDGMNLFRDAAESLANRGVEFRKGNLFEYIEAAKFNADAALKGSPVKAVVTAAVGEPTAPADIKLFDGDRVVREIQAKVSKGSTTGLVGAQAQDKYFGMDRLVPKERANDVRTLAEKLADHRVLRDRSDAEIMADTAKHTVGEVRHGEVASGGTTTSEVYNATRHPRLFAFREELYVVAGEAASAGAQAAAAGAVVGGAISIVKAGIGVARGETTMSDAATSIATDTATASIRAGAAGAGGAVVRDLGARAGLHGLTKSNVATAVAAGTIEVGVTVYRFARGEIEADVAAERVGQTGMSTTASIYTGALAGAAFGPAGAIVGSVAGYLLASSVFQSCVSVLRDARLTREEAHRVIALCDASIVAMEAQRHAFEAALAAHLDERDNAFEACFALVDEAGTSEPEAAILGLTQFAALCGKKLKFDRFEDFDAFMSGTGEPLVL